MNAKVHSLTRNTLLPLGLVVALVIGTWSIATDRQAAIGQINMHSATLTRHEEDITELQAALEYLTGAMMRIEMQLGTVPEPKE